MGMACLEFCQENFRRWLKNREIYENFLPRKFPAIRYLSGINYYNTNLRIKSNEVSLAHLKENVEIEQGEVGVKKSGGIDGVAGPPRGQGEGERPPVNIIAHSRQVASQLMQDKVVTQAKVKVHGPELLTQL